MVHNDHVEISLRCMSCALNFISLDMFQIKMNSVTCTDMLVHDFIVWDQHILQTPNKNTFCPRELRDIKAPKYFNHNGHIPLLSRMLL